MYRSRLMYPKIQKRVPKRSKLSAGARSFSVWDLADVSIMSTEMGDYDALHASFYDETDGRGRKDVAFYVDSAKNAMGPVLELGCGTGRVLLPIAALGIDVVGLDRSREMLAVCKRKLEAEPAEIQRRVELVQGDMCDLALGRRFPLILIPHRSFQHVLTPEAQRELLTRIRAHMTDDARLVFNLFDPLPEMIAACSGHLSGVVRKTGHEFSHPRTDNRVVQLDSTEYELETQTVSVERFYDEFDVAGKRVSRSATNFTLRFTYRLEMQYLLELCGFRVEALYGDFDHAPFRPGGEQVWIAKKA